MKIFASIPFNFFYAVLILVAAPNNSLFGDIILDSGTISVMQDSGGGGVGGTSTFNLSGVNISDVELLANFGVVDAGVDIRINGTSLFPQFDDVSQFSSQVVFLDTGVTQGNGNIESPFGPNNNGLPRLTVNATSAGTTFSGGAFVNSSSTIDYTPNFAVQDFSSLLNSGDNTIEFIVLNSFQGANLQGDFTVTQIETTSTSVPEPSVVGFGLLAFAGLFSRRRR